MYKHISPSGTVITDDTTGILTNRHLLVYSYIYTCIYMLCGCTTCVHLYVTKDTKSVVCVHILLKYDKACVQRTRHYHFELHYIRVNMFL